jgi:uncharacterized protein DUF6542
VARTSSFYGSRSADPDDGWGPATSVRSAAAAQQSAPPAGPPALPRERSGGARRSPATDPAQDAYWSRRDDAPQAKGSARDRLAAVLPSGSGQRQRGLPAWGALLVLLAIAGLGGAIDMLSGTSVRGWFNVGIIVASIVAILLVRRSGMFPIVIAPPIVYSVASGLTLYIRSGGLNDRKVLIDSAANWLVYGFPAIAGATAAVLIIAGVRLIIRK